MADRVTELSERLYRRFKGVPNFDEIDAKELVEGSLEVHDDGAAVDLVLLYAQVQGAGQVAFSVAHYFTFSDGEESVDRSPVAEQRRRRATDLQSQNDKETDDKAGKSDFVVMNRVDRP